MAKKSKNHLKNEESNDVSESNDASSSSTVFKALFGEVPGPDPAANSLFSDNNPFHRKFMKTQPPIEESRLGLAGKEHIYAEYEANLEDSDFSEAKKPKKRKKEKAEGEISGIDDEEVEEKSKKLKRAKLKESENNENSNLVSESGEIVEKDHEGNGDKNEKKKRKRKRDEVEAEYEAKRYGVNDEIDESKGLSNVVGEKRKKMENPEDMMVSKEGFDDEGKLLRTIFVGNLPLKLKKKEIAKEFSKFGEVESVRIRSVPIVDGKIPRKGAVILKKINENGNSVNAYVVFKTEESAQASLAHNMAVVGGNHIRIDRACPPRKKLKGDNTLLYENKRTVFLGNLPFDVKDEEIYLLFSNIKNLETSVEAVLVIRDPGSSLGKGIAYVLFKTVDAANMALKQRNLWIRNRELRLSHAKPADSSSKRVNASEPQSNSATKSRKMDGSYKELGKGNVSYQGLHASKSGGQKKVRTKVNILSAKSKPQPAREKSSGTKKRPAVAARKEKALWAANASNVAGTKRKLGNPSPQSGGQKKKARTSR
ncbi:RNA-binding protein 34-like [Salvia splendens]|uniref:RNA-binding protein 34-like n=1 Tax=Salvia splendens TaxID=180675 RepID=UPI001C26950C|nr:RNA-binding protein 34-like [Salvia splendens]